MKEAVANILKGKRIEDILNSIIKFSKQETTSFACWRLPNDSEIHLLVQFGEPEKLTEIDLESSIQGFLLSPFNNKRSKLFIKSDLHITFKSPSDFNINSNSKSDKLIEFINSDSVELSNTEFTDNSKPESVGFKYLVERSVREIDNGNFTKVVPSRKREIGYSGDFNSGEAFKNLCDKYPTAFVSILYTSESGIWIGATPELLISTQNNIFKTVALAGTQKYEIDKPLADTAWTQKEIEEQALVSRYIINCFKKIRLREFEEHGPKTVKAGNLIHLKTEFKVDMKSTNFPELGSTMLNLLHPTSAVCGMPMQSAQEFLFENEGYDREYYSGYLGPVNINSFTAQYVNLRCMKVDEGKITLFAGAGVTEDSNPEKEWVETELKMNTILNVIKPN